VGKSPPSRPASNWEHHTSIILGYDPETLHEKVDLRAVGVRLDELGEMRSLEALCERAWLLKVAGRLGEALEVANAAVRLARFTGDRQSHIRPRILRAQVLQFQGKFPEALAELNACAEEAHTHDWLAQEAVCLQQRGKVHFNAGDPESALADLTRALSLRQTLGASEDQLESSRFAIRAVQQFIVDHPAVD
jgi:tetratricopeptide (TPR) repeat protein